MPNPIRTPLVGMALIALLGLVTEVHAQAANDVNCSGCVDPRDIANRAVTTGKIKNGAVTVKKVAPPLKNAIGTYCPPGQSVVGMDKTGNFVCEAPLYFPFGPQLDVPEAALYGWTQCFQDTYGDNSGTTIASILARCDGSKLLLACRQRGNVKYNLLAAGERADVIKNTHLNLRKTTTANGSEWYFNDEAVQGEVPGLSWGFAAQGDIVNKNTCDTEEFGDQDRRLCWHQLDGRITEGYRCGAETVLGNSTAWERVIYHAD
jgi:hypothetical protein